MKTADVPEPDIPDMSPDLWGTAQEAVPVPYLAGMRMIGAHYLTPAVEILVVEQEVGGKKGK